jgi:hypothetical protein
VCSRRFWPESTEVPWFPPPPRGPPIPTIRIEAPTAGAATQLVSDLVPFARTDLVPLENERWEILVEDSTDDQLDAVLLAVARWAVACELEDQPVLVDGEPIELPEPPATA